MTPVFDDGQVTLYCADSTKVILPAADLTLTDPPYGTTTLSWDRWVEDWPSLLLGSSLWCFGSVRMFMQHASEFFDAGWKMSHDIVWEKHNGSSFHADRFRRIHEHAVHFYKGTWADCYRDTQYTNTATKKTVWSKRRPPHMGNIERTPYTTHDGGPKLATSIIYAASAHGSALHPTEKPAAILEPLIRYGCPPGGLVLDPFAGSGSTLLTARMLGRRAVGFEIDKQYAEAAAHRLRTFDDDLPAEAYL